jgi:hypothetical protein
MQYNVVLMVYLIDRIDRYTQEGLVLELHRGPYSVRYARPLCHAEIDQEAFYIVY